MGGGGGGVDDKQLGDGISALVRIFLMHVLCLLKNRLCK